MMGGWQQNKSMQKGQTLIEAVIALAVATLVISTFAIITNSSLTSSQKSKDQNLATQFAQEGIELARKDRKPTLAPGATATFCVAEDAEVLEEPPAGSCTTANISGYYVRSVTLSAISAGGSCGANTYQVVSKVAWTDGKCTAKFCRDVELVTCLAP